MELESMPELLDNIIQKFGHRFEFHDELRQILFIQKFGHRFEFHDELRRILFRKVKERESRIQESGILYFSIQQDKWTRKQ